MRRTLLTAALAVSLQAQSFDVVSVKPHEGDTSRQNNNFGISGPRVTITAFKLLGLLVLAYNVMSYQIANAAALDQTQYDITATLADGRTRTREELGPLLQQILADRFQLKVHREVRETPVYALVIAKNGPKIKESPPDTDATRETAVNGINIESRFSRITLGKFAEHLQNNAGLDRPVLDKTGLTGDFEIHLTYAALASPSRRRNAARCHQHLHCPRRPWPQTRSNESPPRDAGRRSRRKTIRKLIRSDINMLHLFFQEMSGAPVLARRCRAMPVDLSSRTSSDNPPILHTLFRLNHQRRSSAISHACYGRVCKHSS
jgi:uncharacterized protein (TIGR03435 family)